MTRKVLSLLFVSLFVLAVAQIATAQESAQAVAATEIVVAPCNSCGPACVRPCCAVPCCDPCGPTVVGYRRGLLGICRPVYAPTCCDPCFRPMPPRFYRSWYRGACCW